LAKLRETLQTAAARGDIRTIRQVLPDLRRSGLLPEDQINVLEKAVASYRMNEIRTLLTSSRA
jgi:hypothetical protein